MAAESKNGKDFLRVKFQKYGSPRFIFDSRSIACHKELVVPMDEYRLHDGKKFLYYGPPPRMNNNHYFYVATRCHVLLEKEVENQSLELYVGDIFPLKSPSGDEAEVWAMIIGFLRHESLSHE